jgi:hypothetical protein
VCGGGQACGQLVAGGLRCGLAGMAVPHLEVCGCVAAGMCI